LAGQKVSSQDVRVESATVGVAGCRREADSAPDDLYPDLDAPSLQAALRSLGVSSALVSWDDPSVAWEQFWRVVISSTWDSVDRPEEYLAWARRVAEVTILVNDVAFVEWNLDKAYQLELDAAGVAVIATEWIAPGDLWAPAGMTEFVVKPSVSAGGRSTARYAGGDPASIEHVRALQGVGQTVMVQPYLHSIDVGGEVNVVFFGGTFSHAVKKQPALQVGRGVVDKPWERMAWEGIVTPTAAQMEVADAALAVARRRVGRYPVYGRVDLIDDPIGTPTVLEIELIDPYLSLDMEPAAAARMAKAILSA
jgi:hypothetical protein